MGIRGLGLFYMLNLVFENWFRHDLEHGFMGEDIYTIGRKVGHIWMGVVGIRIHEKSFL